MKNSLLILCFLLAGTNVFADTSVTSYAITWNFDADYPVGQYVTGDYYVVAPNGLQITNISPGGEGTDSHGSMINPEPGASQGYTSAGTNYVRALNVGYSLPISLSPGDSLVSTITVAVYQSHVQDASVLTVVSSVPAAGSFRPPFCGPTKTTHNINEIDWSKLKQLTPVGSPPTQASTERTVQRPWVDHGRGAGGSWIIAGNNAPTYGRDIIEETGKVALWLHLDYPQVVKQTTLYGFLQIGIDWYYTAIRPGAHDIWMPDGGVAAGHKMPILFAGSVLNNASMLTIGDRSGDYLYEGTLGVTGHWTPPADYIHFQMDGQTFYVNQDDIDITHSAYWTPKQGATTTPYTSNHMGMPEWSIRYADTINQSNADWQTSYRSNTNGQYYSGVILAALIMDLKEEWNHNALFDYTDRYQAISAGLADPFGYTVPSETAGLRPTNFQNAMWDAYRNSTFNGSAPIRSDKQPSGTLASGTTETTMSLSTNVDSTCKYGTAANTAYDSIANTFSTTGGTSHSQSLTGLSNGNSTTYYIRCNNGTDSNISDYAITVAVLGPTETPEFSWQQPTYSALEGENLTATITRTVSTGTATIEWGTHHKTAINEVDYVGVVWTTEASFAAGESTTTVQLETIDNSQIDTERSLTMELQNPSTGTISNPSTTVTIIDDDGGLQSPKGFILNNLVNP